MFGSIAFTHISSELRTKLHDRSKKIIFIGYKSGKLGGYKFYNLATKMVIISKDIIFDETNI